MSDFFLDDGRTFKSPELAAMHATVVQGGFSTASIEARRMFNDGGESREIAREWLDVHEPEWRSGRDFLPGERFKV